MEIIDGKRIAEKIKDEIVAEIMSLRPGYKCPASRPNLAIILAGEREDSRLYVELKEKEAKKVGIDTHLYKIGEKEGQEQAEKTIDFLNKDPEIDAILVQLPLPKGFDTDEIIKKVSPEKDVDRFHPDNLKNLEMACDFKENASPPLLQVVFEILADIGMDPGNKTVCAIVNSDILGQSLKRAFECRGARVNLCRADDDNLSNEACQADILISAVGQPGLIKKEHIKEGACLIDVGIAKNQEGKVTGDIDEESVKEKAGYITPVPGGVGPITIAAALRNTLKLYKKNKCE